MKCYTIRNGKAQNGITVHEGHVHVGEAGRGRRLVRVPLPPGARVEAGALVEIEDPGRGNAAVVRVRDHSGFRGGWRLRGARTAEEWDEIVKRTATHHANAEGDHSGAAGVQCPACPEWPAERLAKWRVLAEGRCAQGDAGRMGGGAEYLAVLAPGQAVEILRGGRLYGAARTVRVGCAADGTVTCSVPRADAEARAAASRL